MARVPLTPEEVEDYWALGVAIEAVYVPDELLEQAIAEKRVEEAYSWSSMGTAETYWHRVLSLGGIDRNSAVAWPPGHVVEEKGHDYDERDVYKWLWAGFFEQQVQTAIKHVPPADRPRVLVECARVLGAMEEGWANDAERGARAPFIALLYTQGPVDEVALDEWLAHCEDQDLAHLVAGVKGRWLTQSIEDVLGAIVTSAHRFGLYYTYGYRKAPLEREAARHALVRLMVGLARGRGWRAVDITSNEAAFVFDPAMLVVERRARTERTAIEKCARCSATPSPPAAKLAAVSPALGFCRTCKTFYAIEGDRTTRLPLLEGTKRLRAANDPAHEKWVGRKWKQDGETMAALGALVVDPAVPRDHVWDYARASILDDFASRSLIAKTLARHPDPAVRAETLDTIMKAAAAGNARAQQYLRDYPPEYILRGLRGS